MHPLDSRASRLQPRLKIGRRVASRAADDANAKAIANPILARIQVVNATIAIVIFAVAYRFERGCRRAHIRPATAIGRKNESTTASHSGFTTTRSASARAASAASIAGSMAWVVLRAVNETSDE